MGFDIVFDNDYSKLPFEFNREATDWWESPQVSKEGIGNRAYFYQMLEGQCAKARERGYGLGLIIVEIDELKTIVDWAGIPADGAVQRVTGLLLKQNVRPEDIVCWLPRFQFGIIVPVCNAVSLQQLEADLSRSVFPTTFNFSYDHGDSYEIPLSITTGSEIFPDKASSALELLHFALLELSRASRERAEKLARGTIPAVYTRIKIIKERE